MNPIAFRRHIHSYPELSFCEESTAKFIESALDVEGIEHRRVATTGVLARIEGRGDKSRAVVLRADIDALPVEEAAHVEFASKNKGVMHACGHDMHAAMLYGVLCSLNKSRDFEGTIIGIFQPGEECNPGGASLVLAEKPLDEYNVLAVIGQHIDATIDIGVMGLRKGKFMASSDELRFEVCGVGGHAAKRALLKDPVAAAAEFVTKLLTLNHPERVLSIGRMEADGATNVIPSVVKLAGTLRTFDQEERAQTKEFIATMAKECSEKHGVDIKVDINHGYPCVTNDEELTEIAAQEAAKMCGVEWFSLLTTAEDFGNYCLNYPSLFYRLGVGRESGVSHTSTFCPSEGAIEKGIELMKSIALRVLDYEKEE